MFYSDYKYIVLFVLCFTVTTSTLYCLFNVLQWLQNVHCIVCLMFYSDYKYIVLFV